MDREVLGQLVRNTFVAWASEQPFHKPSWLVPWDELEPNPVTGADQREVDMRIGEAVAAAERDRLLNGPVTRIEPDPDAPGHNRGVYDIPAAIAQAVAAERERIAAEIDPARLELLADWFDTDDEFKTTMFPETSPHRSREVQDDLRRWAKVLRGETTDG